MLVSPSGYFEDVLDTRYMVPRSQESEELSLTVCRLPPSDKKPCISVQNVRFLMISFRVLGISSITIGVIEASDEYSFLN